MMTVKIIRVSMLIVKSNFPNLKVICILKLLLS